MHVKIISAVLLCSVNAAQAGIFGPANYDECILENLKNASTPAAVATMKTACSNKFPNKNSAAPQGVRLCKIFWDGWKFSLGDMKGNKDFITYSIEKDGVDTVQFSLPRQMEKEFNKSGATYKSAEDVFRKNLDAVMLLCY